MPSTFMGLNIAASGLSAFQTAVSTTANNISNAQTPGYSRQSTTLQATQALRMTARYGSIGTGVAATKITQERDLFYDARYWNNNSSLGLYESKLYYLDQIQGYFKDDNTQTGYTTLFNRMFNNLEGMIGEGAEDKSVRNQFINSAQNLCTYFNSLSDSLSTLQADVNEEIKTTVTNVNAISKKIALLNEKINNVEVRGGYANELRDERANLLDELSKIASVDTREVEIINTYGDNLGGTNFTVTINGQVLVDGSDYRTLDCVSQDYRNNQNDIDGLYSIVWSDTGMNFAVTTDTAGGSLKALFQMRDGNNNEALSGTITGVGTEQRTNQYTGAQETVRTITMTPASAKNLASLDIATRGQINVGNKSYTYDGWEAVADEDGNLIEFKYYLTGELNAVEEQNLTGKDAACGQAVEGMGIPYYQEQINEFLRTFAEMFNDIEKSGQTLDGEKMGAFFVASNIVTGGEYDMSDWKPELANGQTTYTISSSSSSYYMMTGSTMKVNAKSLLDPGYFSTTVDVTNGSAAYDLITKLKGLQDDVDMFRGDSAGAFLETLLSDVSVDTQEVDVFCKTYTSLEASINNLRTSVSGVDEDEEGIALIKFQNAYNMASKVISVMSQMYDKLINETGVA
ncbi:MAG: flagellar hook-associated protein FlgK [Agathobacter sp.]|nr:flagellar hook-associated protein FlgK [Agathobacter sp.]